MTALPSKKLHLPRGLWIAAVAVLAFGIGYRLWFIDYRGYWLDELWSLIHSDPRRTAAQVVHAALVDRHPPLWDLVLHGWMRLFPDWELGPRYLSLIFGIAGIGLVGWYSRKVWQSNMAAVVSMAVMALAFLHIQHTTEARYYGLLSMLAAGFAGQIAGCIQRRNPPFALAGSLLFGIPLVYTHLYGAVLVASVGLALATLVLLRRLTLRQALPGAAICLLTGVCMLPVLPGMFGGTNTADWITPPGAGAFFEYLYDTVGKNPVDFALLLGGLLYVLIGWRRTDPAALVCAWGVVFCFALPFVCSIVWKPMLVLRYTIVYLPLLAMVAGYAVSKVSTRHIRRAAWMVTGIWTVAVINLLFVNPYGNRISREPWKEMAQALNKRHQWPIDMPVYATVEGYFNYYSPPANQGGVRPLSTLDRGRQAFMFLQTPYAPPAAGFFDSLGYHAAIQEAFGKEWAIVYYAR